MEKVIMAKIEFVFNQTGEFDDPMYVYFVDGDLCGFIIYGTGTWSGSLKDGWVYGPGIFKDMAEKIEELNDNLETERKRFWGL